MADSSQSKIIPVSAMPAKIQKKGATSLRIRLSDGRELLLIPKPAASVQNTAVTAVPTPPVTPVVSSVRAHGSKVQSGSTPSVVDRQSRLGLRKNPMKRLGFGSVAASDSKKAKVEIEKKKEVFSRRVAVEVGELVWGKLQGFDWWPGLVVHDWEAKQDELQAGHAWLRWFGQEQYSELACTVDRLAKFELFSRKVNRVKFKDMLYKDAVMTALEIAKRRCGKTFDVSDNEGTETEETETEDTPVNVSAASASATQDNSPSATQDNPPSVSQDSSPSPEKTQITSPPPPVAKEPLPQTQTQKPKSKSKKTKRLKPIRLDDPVEQQLVDWALAGFPPTGPDGFQPSKNEVDGGSSGVAEAEAVVYKEKSVRESSPGQTVKGSGSKLKGAKDLGGSQMENELDKRASCVSKEERERFSDVRNGSRKIESLCLGCASLNPMAEHPLFDGGLCETCKECFEENCYLFDDDGTQMYCAICCDGREVFLCDVMGCSRAYCTFCIEKICGSEEVDKITSDSEWRCFMCEPTKSPHPLKLREDWQKRMQELFSSEQLECDPIPVPQPMSLGERRGIRVLSLFDGISTGYVALKSLGFVIESYVASEIDFDAIKVSWKHHHLPEINHIGDVKKISKKELEKHGPFDLVFGGSPCNDLSVANPNRKGIYEGTGRLFFEYYRILKDMPPPFFWFFENVVSMRSEDRQIISRFLQCNPVVINAIEVSPASRPRYFWGNLPGMSRSLVPLPGDRLTLQDCLEPKRSAQFTKLRTVTTKANSIKQTRDALFPVAQLTPDGSEKGDGLWCTELERLFGFPDHYTDVGSMNKMNRQRLLGQAWSVPVIRHLLSPLKDYFKCNTEPIACSQPTV